MQPALGRLINSLPRDCYDTARSGRSLHVQLRDLRYTLVPNLILSCPAGCAGCAGPNCNSQRRILG